MDLDIEKYFKKESKFRSRRDELVYLITEDINRLREGTKFKKVSSRTIALLINSSHFLKKSDGEIELLYKECHMKNNYSKFWWVTNPKNVV